MNSMKISLKILTSIPKARATPQKQNQTVAAVMKELAVLDVAGHAGDMLGMLMSI